MEMMKMFFQAGHPDYNDMQQFDKHLYVVSCGFQHIDTKDITTSRLNGHGDYHILYLTKGKGNFLINNQECVVEAGTIVFYNYGDSHKYTYYAKDDTCVYWIHFNGDFAKELIIDLIFETSSTIKIGTNSFLCECFENIINELNYKPSMYFKSCCGNLITMLSYIAEIRNDLNQKKCSHADDFAYIISLMNKNEDSHMQVEDYANICHLSKSRFIKNFKQFTGLTPIEYKNQIIIKKAQYLLRSTDLSISEISDLLGFESASYFSTLFKKYVHQPPKAFKQLSINS